MIDKSIKKVDCSGCKMCGDICPKTAIEFTIDSEGFWYPSVNSNACVACELCIRHCPVLNETKNKMSTINPDAYAAWALDEDVRLKSTSGGIYYPLATVMLHEGGYLAGCVYTDGFKSAKHIIGNNFDDLDKIYRTKYFQSDTKEIYIQTKSLLYKGEKVLFCGAPCQNAGLLEYLEKDSDNLITVEFICRGVVSPKVHKAYLDELESDFKSKIKFFQLKNKKKGWYALGSYAEFENGKKRYKSGRVNDPFVKAYTNGIANFTMRPSCANCRFKGLPRIADITFADFWGYKTSADNMFKGVSAVLINTEKGRGFFEKVKPQLFVESHDWSEIATDNTNLYKNSLYADSKIRKEFFGEIEDERFSKVVWRLLRTSPLRLRIRYNLSSIKKVLSRLRK